MSGLPAFVTGRQADVRETSARLRSALTSAAHRSLRRAGRSLARLLTLMQPRPQASVEADEAGDATLRDLGLDADRPRSAFHLADIHAGFESTRMRLFAMTGQYWRGS